jgi:hypothetical protein
MTSPDSQVVFITGGARWSRSGLLHGVEQRTRGIFRPAWNPSGPLPEAGSWVATSTYESVR